MTETDWEAVRVADWPYVQQQLVHESQEDLRRCYYCDALPPGLLFQPSETGVCEMPLWVCPRCIAEEVRQARATHALEALS